MSRSLSTSSQSEPVQADNGKVARFTLASVFIAFVAVSALGGSLFQ